MIDKAIEIFALECKMKVEDEFNFDSSKLKEAIEKEIEKAFKAGLIEGHGTKMDTEYIEELWQQYKKTLNNY